MINQEHMIASISATFAALALVLAAIGLYGITGYAVARRTGELGIRMALGATPRDVHWLVFKESSGLAVLGLGIGVTIVLPLAQLTSKLLYGVNPIDAPIFALASLMLVLIAAIAGHVPARRASHIDPMLALRRQ
jgi:ABC-type antimicrobial peptide transport system permease subunit